MTTNFNQDHFKKYESAFSKLKTGQSPETLIITCSDSRVCPTIMTDSGPGDLFVIRNAGNLVPANSDTPTNEGATIEYAVKALKVKNIVVCGHSGCGAMGAIANIESVKDFSILYKALESKTHMLEKLPSGIEGDEKLAKLIEINVHEQINNLKTYPFVKEAVDKGELKLIGWVYDFINEKQIVLT